MCQRFYPLAATIVMAEDKAVTHWDHNASRTTF